MHAFGYFQLTANSPDEEVLETELALREFAAERDLNLTSMFFEESPGSHRAFDTMLTELQQRHARHVVVPSMRHLARNRLLQNMMLDRLEHTANAEVLAIVDETATS
ncbi:recombinase family protein [Amycolatopsis magusensis]|uniref:recombinase family protein n=1 Tax=Amycolatopsis magusensis TaxID=882444 RepID=UPI0037913546